MHEALPLFLLQIHDRGRETTEMPFSRARRAAVTPVMTLKTLINDHQKFAIPGITMDDDRFFVHLGMSLLLLSCIPSFFEKLTVNL